MSPLRELLKVWLCDSLVVRLPFLRRAEYLAFAFHRAVARAHIFCLLFISFSFSIIDSLLAFSWPEACRRVFNFISRSLSSLCLRRTCFRQNRQPIMKKQMKNASTSDSARIRVVRLWYGFATGFQPGGNESRMS